MPAVLERPGKISVCWFDDLRPTQEKFFFSPATRKVYIGGFGCGKSEILCRSFLDLLWRRPGNEGIIGRFKLNEFQATTLVTLKRLLPGPMILDWNESRKTVVIRSRDPKHPSIFRMVHFDEENQYGSWEGGVAAFDEITEIPYRVWQYVVEGRLRMKAPDGSHLPAYYGLGAGNPAGHDAYWRAFHPESPDHVDGYELFTPQPYENAQNLRPDYYPNLERRFSKAWVDRYVRGSFDHFEGQVYPDLVRKTHFLPNNSIPYPPPLSWPRLISLDHGLRAPTSVGFWAIDNDGRMWRYDEHYEAGRPVKHHAEEILKKYNRHCRGAVSVEWIADPSIFNEGTSKGDKFESIFDEYTLHGLDDWQPGDNAKEAGRNRVTEMIRAGMILCLERCANWWREMTGLKWRHIVLTKDGEQIREEEADVDNHTCDETRYAAMTRPEPAVAEKLPSPFTPKEARIARVSRLVHTAKRRARERSGGSTLGSYVD